MSALRVSRLHSLRAQLTAGAILLLVITIAAVGYLMTVHQRRVLTTEIRKQAVLQGRNLALTSEKFLLRDDPEFDLYPMIERIVSAKSTATSVVVVDNEGIIYGHRDLVEIGQLFVSSQSQRDAVEMPGLEAQEQLFDSNGEYVFVTPIVSGDQSLGYVYLSYTKDGLNANVRATLLITLIVSLGALVVGVILSLVYFRHISRPMRVMLDGVRAMDGESPNVKIDMPTRNEFSILAKAFNDMSGRIDEARRALSARERMQRELELAREIQHSLLPRSIEPPPGYDIDHYYEAAYEVGGDYVDVVSLDERRLAIAMGDVSGKGVQGLVVMAMVKTLFHQLAPRSRGAREIICDLNAALYGTIKKNMFVTFLVAILDRVDGSVTVANAGHNPSLLYRNALKTVDNIRLGAPPLGVFPSLHFNDLVEQRTQTLHPNDVLVLYTDGVNESRDPSGNQFTIRRIEESLLTNTLSDAKAIVAGIVADTDAFRAGTEQVDDITLLALKALTPTPSKTTGATEATA